MEDIEKSKEYLSSSKNLISNLKKAMKKLLMNLTMKKQQILGIGLIKS